MTNSDSEMDFKEYLLSLEWNTFDRYPDQGSDIFIHCFTEDDSIHKFVKLRQFNGVCFDFKMIINSFPNNQRWRFTWLPAAKIEDNNDNSISC